MKKKKETAGKAAIDLLEKKSDPVSVIDQQRAMQDDYTEQLLECISDFHKMYPNTDFYAVVLVKTERLLKNIMRQYFFGRFSCPTPEWDQTVYLYKHRDEDLVFLWTIPSREACKYLSDNALTLPKDQRELLSFVLDYEDGTLLKKSKLLNGEKADTPELI